MRQTTSAVTTNVELISRRKSYLMLFVAQSVKEDVAKRDKDIEYVEKLGQSIAEDSHDPETAKEINERIKKVKEPVNEIRLNIKERCENLESALTESQGFHDNLDEFLRWLTTTERTLAREAPISGNPEECGVQQKDVEVCESFNLLRYCTIWVLFTAERPLGLPVVFLIFSNESYRLGSS